MKQENDEVGWMKRTQMLMFRTLPKVKNTNACFKGKVSNKIKESITWVCMNTNMLKSTHTEYAKDRLFCWEIFLLYALKDGGVNCYRNVEIRSFTE